MAFQRTLLWAWGFVSQCLGDPKHGDCSFCHWCFRFGSQWHFCSVALVRGCPTRLPATKPHVGWLNWDHWPEGRALVSHPCGSGGRGAWAFRPLRRQRLHLYQWARWAIRAQQAFVLSSVEALVNNWWRKLLRCPVLCTAVTFLGMMLCLYQVSFLFNIIPWEAFSCCLSRPPKENPNYPFVLGLSFYLCSQIWSIVFVIQIQNQFFIFRFLWFFNSKPLSLQSIFRFRFRFFVIQCSWTAGQSLIGVEECRLRWDVRKMWQLHGCPSLTQGRQDFGAPAEIYNVKRKCEAEAAFWAVPFMPFTSYSIQLFGERLCTYPFPNGP